MFTLSHVKKSFGDNPVLRDVSIKVNDGDVVAVSYTHLTLPTILRV